MTLNFPGRKAASLFAMILGVQGIVYSQPLTEASKVYWTSPPSILRADPDGSNYELLVTELPKASDLALDPVGGKMYWTDSRGDIHRASQDGSGVEDLLDGVGAVDIEVDAQRGKMYWTSTRRIQRANLDGSSVETIIAAEGGYRFLFLALDMGDAKIYWIDNGGVDYGRRIQRADLDGTRAEVLVGGDEIMYYYMSSLTLDVTEGMMYWLGDNGDRYTIYRANLDGSGLEDLFPRSFFGYPTIYFFVLDTIGKKMYWEEHIRFHGYRINTLRADLDGSNVEAIDVLPPRISAFHPEDGKVYWTNGYVIQRADYDGLHVDGFKMEGVEDLVRVSQRLIPRGIALDPVGKKMYWTDEGRQTIDRADLDGSNAEILVEGLRNPMGIDIDETRGKMYWTEYDRIGRADLDGSSAEVLVEGLTRPYGIEIHGAGRRVYWTDRMGIQRADLDGSDVEVLVRSESSHGRRIAIDGVEGKMYWTHEEKIQLADLSGSNVETFLPEEVELPDLVRQSISIGMPASIAVDEVGRKLYWSAYEFRDPYYPDYLGFTAMKKAGLDDDSAAAEFVGDFFLAEDIVIHVPESTPTIASISRTSPETPAETRLGPSYPNPFNADTRIAYRIAEPGPVRLEIYNVLGQLVSTLVDQVHDAGSYEVQWEALGRQGAALASGVYLTRLQHPAGVHSLKLVFLR